MTPESPANPAERLRVLVVDDSAFNRQTIAGMLERLPGVEVVGRATNGKEALQLVFDLRPHLITLDLEMPEIDGFAFLRLLMQRRPTAVLVVSTHSARDDVFRALELGALDFIAKPGPEVTPELRSIERELVAKVELVRRLQVVQVLRLHERATALQRATPAAGVPQQTSFGHSAGIVVGALGGAPRVCIAIAASTGGPPAVQHLLAQLPRDLPATVLIAQHMPARFTRAFAERLDRVVPMRVVEAEDGVPLMNATAYVAPGSAHLEVALGGAGPIARVSAAANTVASVTPSADRLFRSATAVFGVRLCTVVLTGMGTDGTEGARVAHAAGAHVLAEDPQLAVMSGMPQSAIGAGIVHEVAPLDGIVRLIGDFVAKAGL